MRTQKVSRPLRRRLVISAQSIVLLLLLAFLGWTAFSIGFAGFFTTIAARTARLDAANSAISLNAKDPEAHYTRGGLLVSEDPAAANADTTQAVALRPRDYVFWLGLAQTRELIGDIAGAIDAASQASRLAPSYAQPRWRLGNMLVRAGRTDEGFRELRRAAESDPALLPSTIDLAWQLSHGDAEYVRRAVQPNTTEGRIAVSDYFRKHRKFAEAADLIREAGQPAEEYRRRLMNELISEKQFADAYRLWIAVHGTNSDRQNSIFDPSFEQGSDFTEPGFGWRAAELPRVSLAIDSDNVAEGKASLKRAFNGESEPGLALLSQIVMLEPGARYALKFAGRSDHLVSGGLPIIRLIDAVSGSVLGEAVFRQSSDGWLEYTIDFAAPARSSVIEIRLQRQNCTTSPCPIFGTLWVDKFYLQKR